MPLGELGRIYREGEVIYREGDSGNVMYVVQEGSVRVTKSTAHGEEHIVTLGPGDIFGEAALFGDLRYAATITAHSDARILSVDKNRFIKGMCRDPSLVFNLLKVMSDRIRHMEAQYLRLKNRIVEIMEWGMDLEETCRVILEEARDTVDADNGSVMLADAPRKVFRIVDAFGTDHPEKALLGLGEGIAGRVFSMGKAELVKVAAADPNYKRGGLPVNSIICAPLGTRERYFGVLNLSISTKDLVFTADDLRHIECISTYASVAMENAICLTELTSVAHDLLARFNRSAVRQDEEDE
jgi:CRP-like cAMP-binding protein